MNIGAWVVRPKRVDKLAKIVFSQIAGSHLVCIHSSFSTQHSHQQLFLGHFKTEHSNRKILMQ